MRKICILLLLLASASCFAENLQWIKNPEKAYPNSKYIKAVGEGTSVKAAQSSAISDIALFFNTKVDVLTVAVEEMKEVSSGDEKQYASSKEFQKVVNISSTAEFFGVKFTDPYYDKKKDKYSVLGYIDKNEASQVYTSRIQALMDGIESYRTYANQEEEIFLSAQALAKAIKISDFAKRYIDIEAIIFPNDTQKFQNELKIISQLPAEFDALKKRMTFSIIMNQKETKFDPLFSCVAGILESKGCAYSLADSNYKIVVDVSCIEEEYEAGPFVRASADVIIVNNKGNGVYSYSKAFPRTGSTTMEQAYTRTITKIKQDFEQNLLAEFF